MTTPTHYYPVVVFDLDGTLLRRTTVSLLLAEHLGQAETINELERAFAAGEMSNRAIADASAACYAGRTTSEIRSVLAAATWIDATKPSAPLRRPEPMCSSRRSPGDSPPSYCRSATDSRP
jgi:phosphoserine phosphatase